MMTRDAPLTTIVRCHRAVSPKRPSRHSCATATSRRGCSSGGARHSPAFKRSPGPARAMRNGGGLISAGSRSTRSRLRHRREPAPTTALRSSTLWQSLSTHYATGIAHIAGALARQADPSRLGRAVFIDLDRAVKDHPELLERYLLTEAVTPGADYLRPSRGVLDRRNAALCTRGA